MSKILKLIINYFVNPSKRDEINLRNITRFYIFPSKGIKDGSTNIFYRSRIGFGLVFWMRRIYNSIFHKIKFFDLKLNETAEKTIPHNFDGVWRITRQRTERLINIVRSIRNFSVENSNSLIIGPRNEGELILFWGYGFNRNKIKSIDLISVSPLINLMDMHDLKFKDNEFDFIYSSYVLTYSNDPQKSIDEMVRVAKKNSILAIAWGIDYSKETNIVGTKSFRNGILDLKKYFKNYKVEFLWQEKGKQNTKSAFSAIIRLLSK